MGFTALLCTAAPKWGGLGGGGILGRDPHLLGGNPQFCGAVTPISGVVVPISGGPDPHFLWGVIPNFGEV